MNNIVKTDNMNYMEHKEKREYLNAKDILPPELLEQVKKYAAGKYLYVPKSGDDMKSWGELSGYREQFFDKDL